MTDSAYRIAPCGFTDDEWETFNREGILFFEDALDQEAIDGPPPLTAFANPAPNTGRGRPSAARISSSAIPPLPR